MDLSGLMVFGGVLTRMRGLARMMTAWEVAGLASEVSSVLRRRS